MIKALNGNIIAKQQANEGVTFSKVSKPAMAMAA